MRRLAGYATNPAARRTRMMLHREQHHVVAGQPLVLPPDHDLPFYQRRDPTYDAYAVTLVAELAAGAERMLVVDLGANVGDTAVACLGAAPNVDVVAVEGLPFFATYLRRNTEAYGDRCRVVESFVGPVAGVTERGFITTGTSTGRFARGVESGEPVEAFVSPEDLLADVDDYDQVTWKSDIDGLDIHVLVQQLGGHPRPLRHVVVRVRPAGGPRRSGRRRPPRRPARGQWSRGGRLRQPRPAHRHPRARGPLSRPGCDRWWAGSTSSARDM